MPKEAHFSPAFFQFLKQLARNNTREWFTANKPDFEESVKTPMQRFLADLEPRMAKLAPRIKVGSMQRMNRDTRFSKDKSPYKCNVGAMLMVEGAGDLMLGYHISLAPGESKAYVGLWEPDGPTLDKVRGRILTQPHEWKKAVGGPFGKLYTFEGESLKRPPKVDGSAIDETHPLIADLKRKSHAAAASFTDKDVCSPGFLDEYLDTVRAGSALMEFLCAAAKVKY